MEPETTESDECLDVGVRTLRRRTAATALPHTGERLLPWLGAAMVVGLATLGTITFNTDLTTIETTSLLVCLCATLTVAGLVAARSGNESDATEREERARPARDQLDDQDGGVDAEAPSARSYLEGMEGWAIALLELIEHAAGVTSDGVLRDELMSASEDTDALRALLHSSVTRDLNLNEAATLHSVCALWETSQERIEQLAAEIDPHWHRRWRARTLVERLLRHGPPKATELVLPYRT